MKLSFTQSLNGIDEAVFTSEETDPYQNQLSTLRITLTGTTIQTVVENILTAIDVCVTKKKRHGDTIRTDALNALIRVLQERNGREQPLFVINKPDELCASIETVRTALTSALSDQTPVA